MMSPEGWVILGIVGTWLLILVVVHIRALMFIRQLENENSALLQDLLNWERLYHQTKRDTLSGEEWKNDNGQE